MRRHPSPFQTAKCGRPFCRSVQDLSAVSFHLAEDSDDMRVRQRSTNSRNYTANTDRRRRKVYNGTQNSRLLKYGIEGQPGDGWWRVGAETAECDCEIAFRDSTCIHIVAAFATTRRALRGRQVAERFVERRVWHYNLDQGRPRFVGSALLTLSI